MEATLSVAAVLAFAIGLAHSYLGERYILVRLFRREEVLPRLFGGTWFTARTLRFAWHLTTLSWWGFAAILFLLATDGATPGAVACVIAMVFLVSGGVAMIASRGRHLAWIVFLLIGGAAGWAAWL